MNILFISQDVPIENFSGASIRSAFIYKELTAIANVDTATADYKPASRLQSPNALCGSYLGHIEMTADPWGIDPNNSPIRKQLDALVDISGYDYIFVRYYWLSCVLGVINEPNLILDCDDCVLEVTDPSTMSAERYEQFRENYIRRLSAVNLVLFAKKSNMIPWVDNFHIFPNCISAPRATGHAEKGDPACGEHQGGSGGERSAFTVLFVGKLDYQHNYESLDWFVDNVWERFSRIRPGSRLRICGWGLPEDLAAKWRSHPNINYRGYVDSIDEVYEGVDVSVSPAETGSGTHIKIIESLIRGVTMVITLKSRRGYEDTLLDGESLFVVRGKNEFIERLSELAGDADLRKRMAGTGRRKVYEHYTYDCIRGRLAEMVMGLEPH